MSGRGRGRGGYYDNNYYPPDNGGGGGYNQGGPRGRSGGGGGWRSGPPDGGNRSGWGYQDRYDDGYRQQGGGGYSGGGPRDGGGGGYRGGGRGGAQQQHYQSGPPQQQHGGGGYYDDGGGRGGGGGRRGRGRGRYDWGRGGGPGSSRFRPRPRDALPDDIAALTELKQHTRPVTCMTVDAGSQQLYTGGQDGLVCAWSCASGQLVHSADCGMPVDCLLAESGYLFAGVSQKLDSAIKVWNLGAGGAQHELTGHQGQVLALAVAPQSGLLFSGGLDATIRVWELNAAAGTFACTATLTKDAGGHRAAVHALLVAGQFLFSGDRAGAIKAWSLASGQCVQTVERAHSGPIMRMLLWGDNYLLTAAMDGSIRCWSPSSGAPGAPVLNPEPEFVFAGDDNSGGTSGGGGGGGGASGGGGPGAGAAILTMCACSDAAGQSVLMVSYLGDRAVRLFDLPSFDARGCLPNVHECRALLTLPEANTMLASDRNGAVKIFQWKAPPMAA